MSSALTNGDPKAGETRFGTSNLSREKIQQLLAAVGSESVEDTTQIEAAEYNWHQPHYFNSAQLNKLNNFTKEVAAAIAKKFGALCNGDFNVTIASTTQHFGGEFLDQTSQDQSQLTGNYYLAFGTDRNRPCGFISLPLKTAIIWTTQLLGDPQSQEDSDKDLSELEESLLLDITSAVVEAFSASLPGNDFQPAKAIGREQLPLEVQSTEQFCKITFNVGTTDPENPDQSTNTAEACLLIPCSRLDTVTGKTAQTDDKFSADDTSKTILEHLQQISVPITARVASTQFTFEEVMGLQVNDILLLDRKVDEPVELIVEGRTILRGQLAKSAGKYAVAITELANATA